MKDWEALWIKYNRRLKNSPSKLLKTLLFCKPLNCLGSSHQRQRTEYDFGDELTSKTR